MQRFTVILLIPLCPLCYFACIDVPDSFTISAARTWELTRFLLGV